MIKVIFKSQSINTPELFPINIFDKIPENHPVILVDQVFNSLDISTLLKKHKGDGKSANGYESQVFYYQTKRCDGCPLRSLCHQAKGNKTIEVNHPLNQLRTKAKELLTSEKGFEHRSKRPIEVEAVFGQLKSNNKFNRFTFKGIEKAEMKFLLMAIGHNFRKMVANNNKKHKTHIKFSVRVRNRVTEVEIYLFKNVTEYFS